MSSSRLKSIPASLAEIIGWHLGWAISVIAGGVIAAASAQGLSPDAAGALVLGLVPPAASLVLLTLDGPKPRTALIILWAVCAASACGLTGGVAGPLAAWCLAPIAAAAVLAQVNILSRAAALSLACAAVLAFAGLVGWTSPVPEPLLALWLGATALMTTSVGLGAALIIARRRARPAAVAEIAPVEAAPQPDRAAAAILEGQPYLIILLDGDGRVARSFGDWPAGLGPNGPIDLVQTCRPEDRARLADAISRARSEGSAAAVFTTEQAIDRLMSAELRTLPNGELIAVIRDVTDEQAKVEMLEAARADAEALAAGKSQFLAGMSHELRTPLNAIMGFSDIMRNRMFGELPGKYVEYADLIHESGSHLLDLINDVLDMSKIEAQRYELSLEAMDAREPVAAALRILRLQADELGVSLRAALPATATEVDADRRALKQIVLNLVSNALKFTPKGGSVTVSLLTRGADLELAVADTGVGIAQADLARLGRPYEQVGDAGKKAQGTGLGLSLVRSFAELHGGEMTIESRLGEGTAVTVRLPVVHQERPAPIGDNVVAFNPQR